ncbi:hypothetical protein [Saccharothrix xinjiangensis]|uniref:Uncharacterized protein n=1 Tax=Saccharothrix xinjiangensis TaxID=204798 RepID=A0ABV9XYP1_9PSEU
MAVRNGIGGPVAWAAHAGAGAAVPDPDELPADLSGGDRRGATELVEGIRADPDGR